MAQFQRTSSSASSHDNLNGELKIAAKRSLFPKHAIKSKKSKNLVTDQTQKISINTFH
jgi:hypothetical protein